MERGERCTKWCLCLPRCVPAWPAGHQGPVHTVSNLPQEQASEALSCWLTQGSSFMGSLEPPTYGLGSSKNIFLPSAGPPPPSGASTCSETQLKAIL